MGITVGVIVLFILRPALGSAHFTLPRVQIVVGAVLLVNAAVVASGVGGKRGEGSAGIAEGRFGAARDAHPATAQRPLTVDGGCRGPRHRAAVRRLSRRAGAHRRLRRRGRGPGRRPTAVQRGGVRVRGDPADRLPGGPGPHPRHAVGAATTGCGRGADARSPSCWPWSAACCSARGSPDSSRPGGSTRTGRRRGAAKWDRRRRRRRPAWQAR